MIDYKFLFNYLQVNAILSAAT